MEPNTKQLTADIIVAYVSHNTLCADRLADLIKDVFAALDGPVSASPTAPSPIMVPDVPVEHSVLPDHIVCLEDGKRFKSLKSHLLIAHGLSPAAYRNKWGLSEEYPMVAPSYTETRSKMAKAAGLGLKGSHTPKFQDNRRKLSVRPSA